VFIGGGFGASLRYGLGNLSSKLSLPLWTGTFIANALGCLSFFIVWKYFHQFSRDYHHLLKVGLLGGLTTFSTFSFEVSSKVAEGKIKEAILIFSLNMFVGVIVGVWILR
jgi:CrcB protein